MNNLRISLFKLSFSFCPLLGSLASTTHHTNLSQVWYVTSLTQTCLPFCLFGFWLVDGFAHLLDQVLQPAALQDLAQLRPAARRVERALALWCRERALHSAQN